MRELILSIALYLGFGLHLILFGGCNSECGDIFDKSPQQLLRENKYVGLGTFVAVDTLASLGDIPYLGSISKFFLIEYRFQIESYFKGEAGISELFLWNCERVRAKDNYSTISDLQVSQEQLVYGNSIEQPEDLIFVMAPMVPVDDLVKAMNGDSDAPEWNVEAGEITVARKLLSAEELKSMLEDRSQLGRVIHGTDESLKTFDSFRRGMLCYYDENGKATHVTAQNYLKAIHRVSL